MKTLPLLLLNAALVAAGCTHPTILVVTVEGDLVPGMDMDALDVALYRDGAQVLSAAYTLDRDDELPLRYRIEAPSKRESLVELRATASLDGHPVMEATRDASFVSGRESEVRICLWRRCIGSDEASCEEGRCDAPVGDAGPDGGIDATPDGDDEILCSDSCLLAEDGLCDDGGRHSVRQLCSRGTDCTDCGPRLPAACEPACENRQCGPDGCDGECGPGCEADQTCAPGGACVRWVEVPAGTFMMGVPEGQVVAAGIGEDHHEVTLTRSFKLTELEVSQTWYAALAGHQPSRVPECGAACPTQNISWSQAAALTNVLSRLSGLEDCYYCTETAEGEALCERSRAVSSPYDCDGYRLPTEAEWEYAARAGTTLPTYNGDLDWSTAHCDSPHEVLDPIAWFCGNTPSELPQPRGQLQPNDFGLYDMLGNVFEYVDDWYGDYPTEPVVDPWTEAGERRVNRGGAYASGGQNVRAGARATTEPSVTGATVGLRVARTVQ